MQETRKRYRHSLTAILLLFLLLSIFLRPATAASTRLDTPPSMVTVVRIADLDIPHATENLGHVEDV